jgi:hypothetical protein
MRGEREREREGEKNGNVGGGRKKSEGEQVRGERQREERKVGRFCGRDMAGQKKFKGGAFLGPFFFR